MGRNIDWLDESTVQRRAKRLIDPMLFLDPILDELKTVIEYHSVIVAKVIEGYSLTVGYRGDTPLAEAMRSSFRADMPEATTEWLRKKVPMLVADVLDDSPDSQALRLRFREKWGGFSNSIGSFISVPLAAGDRLIGSLGVDHRERGHYTVRDVELLQDFIERRFTEIEYAIFYEEAARLADEAQAALTVQQTIVRRLNPEAILQKTAEEVLRLTAARRALVFLCEENEFRLASAAGERTPWVPVGWQTPRTGSVLNKALELGRPMFFDSLETLLRVGATDLLPLGNRCMLIFPLRSENHDLGAIVAVDKVMGVFGPNDERVVDMLASTAAIGLENARVHLQAKRLARMEERQRIAQSLHETMAQMLFSNGLAIKRVLENPLDSESARQSLEIAHRLSARSSEELRSAIFALSKPELRGGHSLIDLLLEQVEEFQSESGVTTMFVTPAHVTELPHPVGEAIYRIVRESLTNVRKHAQAVNVEVRLLWKKDSVEVTIQDDGNGLDESSFHRGIGQDLKFGVVTMQQLAAQVDGELLIANNEKGGVTVKARLPI
ncbi:MAG: GAF domain-containing protein [Anaerolineales bacterium]|nr:GAF domain-containing protein [Anaerolineales bacterium]